MRRHDERAWLAWHIGYLGRVSPKKFPKLDRLLAKQQRAARVPQTVAQQYEAVMMWNALYGGRVADKRKAN